MECIEGCSDEWEMYVRAMNTVIGCQNCEVKDFMLKCAHDWNAWLVGVREIFGNLSFRRQ